MQLQKESMKSFRFDGIFEPLASVILVQCSIQLG